jgi:subtilisin-like proprotein convertase family protein
MQPKFTLKKGLQYFQKALVVIAICMTGFLNAQTISTASGTGYGGDLSINNTDPLTVSFVIQNTSGAAVALTNVSTQMAPFGTISNAGDASVTKLFVSSTSLSGVFDISTPAWTQIGSGNAVVPATVTVTPVIAGINYIIPSGAQLRFVLELSKGLRISGPFAGFPLPTPNSFSSGGITLKLGDNQIAGANVGYGGVTPAAPPGNTPVFFGGSVTLVSTVPCTGTPAPGNTLPATSSVCPGLNFNLSLQNATSGSGVTYQWQTATAAAGPWTNITGATNSTFTGTMVATAFYRCQVTCSGNTGTSNSAQVSLNPPSACYCTPPATDCTDDDVILRVRLNTLDNASTCGTGPPPGYTNYSTTVAAPNIFAGAANPITIDHAPTFSKADAVWIDYNQNGQFEVSEFSAIGLGVGGTATITGLINVPATATLGVTRMRVRTKFVNTQFLATQACTNPSGFGETEDYNVNIVPCVPVTITSAPANATINCGAPTVSFTVGATGSLPAYSWQYRTNATSVWQTLTNGAFGGLVSGATTATVTLAGVGGIPQTFSGYQFRALVSGGCSAVDFSTPPATLTVNSLVPVVSPSSSTICLGSVLPLTLTNTVSAPTTVTFNGTGLPLAIPDATLAGVNSSATVSGIPAGSLITNIDVRFSVPAHTWAGDLCAVLRGPSGAIINLDYFISGTGAGPTPTGMVNTVIRSSGGPLLSTSSTPYTGIFRADAVTTPATGNPPSGPTGFIPTTATWTPITGAASPNGNYTFAIYDAFGGDNGSLTAWSITITYVAPVFAQGTWNGPAGTIFTDAAASTAYTGTPATTVYVKPTVGGLNNYTVSFTTPTPCNSTVTTVPVNVSVPVTLPVNPSNTAACVGNNASFTVSATGSPLTYQWQVSTDGGTTYTNVVGATAATLTLNNVAQAMNNNRYRAIISANPCTPPTTTTGAILTVNALPTVTITAPDLSLIPGQRVNAVASSTPAAGATSTWNWTRNGASIVGTTNTRLVDVDSLGTYRVRVTDINGCVNTSAPLTFTGEASDRLWIYPNPTPTGNFQVRLYFDPASTTEERIVTIFNSEGQQILTKSFVLANTTQPYMRMDFALNLGKGAYVVKVAHRDSGKITSGIVLVQ